MHYGINSPLLSMQQQKLGQRRRCAGCCLSHYCHCAIWAMPSCHVVSYLLFFNSSYIDFTSLWNQRQIEYFHLPLSSSGRSRSWVSASIRQFPHCTAPPHHCPSGHAAETRRQQSLITIIATQVLAQQTRRAPQLLAVYHHHNIQMINESQAVTWIWYPQLLKLQQNTGTGHWTWYKQPASSLWTVAVQTMLKRLHSHGGHVFNFCIKYVHNKWILGPKDPLFFGKSVQI